MYILPSFHPLMFCFSSNHFIACCFWSTQSPADHFCSTIFITTINLWLKTFKLVCASFRTFSFFIYSISNFSLQQYLNIPILFIKVFVFTSSKRKPFLLFVLQSCILPSVLPCVRLLLSFFLPFSFLASFFISLFLLLFPSLLPSFLPCFLLFLLSFIVSLASSFLASFSSSFYPSLFLISSSSFPSLLSSLLFSFFPCVFLLLSFLASFSSSFPLSSLVSFSSCFFLSCFLASFSLLPSFLRCQQSQK